MEEADLHKMTGLFQEVNMEENMKKSAQFLKQNQIATILEPGFIENNRFNWMYNKGRGLPKFCSFCF